MAFSKRKKNPIEQRENKSYLSIKMDNREAKKIVEESKDLPHLQKPIKYDLKK